MGVLLLTEWHLGAWRTGHIPSTAVKHAPGVQLLPIKLATFAHSFQLLHTHTRTDTLKPTAKPARVDSPTLDTHVLQKFVHNVASFEYLRAARKVPGFTWAQYQHEEETLNLRS